MGLQGAQGESSRLPLYDNVLSLPAAHLASRHPVWSKLPHQDHMEETLWCDIWRSTLPPDTFLITDPTVCTSAVHGLAD